MKTRIRPGQVARSYKPHTKGPPKGIVPLSPGLFHSPALLQAVATLAEHWSHASGSLLAEHLLQADASPSLAPELLTCEVAGCGYAATHSGALRDHMRTQTEERHPPPPEQLQAASAAALLAAASPPQQLQAASAAAHLAAASPKAREGSSDAALMLRAAPMTGVLASEEKLLDMQGRNLTAENARLYRELQRYKAGGGRGGEGRARPPPLRLRPVTDAAAPAQQGLGP